MAKDRQRIENTSGVIWIQDTLWMTICQYQISGNDQILPQAHMRLWEAHTLPYPIASSRRKKKPARHSMTHRSDCQKPFREVWRAAALQMQSESGDMCGGFGPCRARLPCAVSRPGGSWGREGNSVKIRKRTPQADFFDALTGPLPVPARRAGAHRSRRNSRPARAERCSCRCPPG